MLLKTPSEGIKGTKFAFNPEVYQFHALAMVDAPEEARRMQGCLRSWFLAYCVFWADASSSYEELAFDGVIYEHLDTMFSEIIAYSINPERDGDDYKSIYMKAIGFFSSKQVDEAKQVREWFMAFLPRFDDRADDFDMKMHTYTYSTILEFLEVFMIQKYRNIERQVSAI